MKYIIPTLLFLSVVILFLSSFKHYSANEGFNDDNINIYVISLRHEDRLKNIEEQRNKINRDIEIFDAVKGDTLNIDTLMNDGEISRNWENGAPYKKREVGCYLSHFNIYKNISASLLLGYTIIFEDDFKIESDNFMDDVNAAIETTNGEFDMLFLGNINNNNGKLFKNNIYYVNNNETLIGMHSYIVNNKNIEKIIKETMNIDMPIDLKIDNLSKNNKLNILVMYPIIVRQESNTSTIRDMTIETLINR